MDVGQHWSDNISSNMDMQTCGEMITSHCDVLLQSRYITTTTHCHATNTNCSSSLKTSTSASQSSVLTPRAVILSLSRVFVTISWFSGESITLYPRRDYDYSQSNTFIEIFKSSAEQLRKNLTWKKLSIPPRFSILVEIVIFFIFPL